MAGSNAVSNITRGRCVQVTEWKGGGESLVNAARCHRDTPCNSHRLVTLVGREQLGQGVFPWLFLMNYAMPL